MPLRPLDPPTLRLLARMALWLAVASGAAAALAALLAVVEVRGVPLLTHASHVPVLADPNLTRRLADADMSGPVDVVLVGSSHAFRELDPRAFARRGLRAFNLGSSAQAPMLTDALLARYLPRLRPHLVIVETYPVTLDSDGVEGVVGLIAATPVDASTLRLAARLRTPGIALALVGSGARRAFDRPAARADGRYVTAGFVERTDTVADMRLALRRFPTAIHLDGDDLADLDAVIDRVRQYGATVVFVEMPVTGALRRYVAGYDDASMAVEADAERRSIPFLRVGAWPLGLVDTVHFYDPDHLNAAGNTRVNAALLDTLARRGLLPPPQ